MKVEFKHLRRSIFACLFFCLVWLVWLVWTAVAGDFFGCGRAERAQSHDYPISVYFSPHGGCTAAIADEIGKARSLILVQAYGFTSAPIAKALLEAHKRMVKVEVILDRSNRRAKYSEADFLHNVGIPVLIDIVHTIAYNKVKVIVIDGETVITGSFNFTRSAEEKNAENLLVIRNKSLAETYAQSWKQHAAHSVTGKLYVREAARHLSEEAEEPTTMEAGNADVELGLEGDDISEEIEA